MNYSYKLIELYKVAKGYSQDKQVGVDLPKATKGSIASIKAGTRSLTAEQALFIANEIGLSHEEVIINLGIEKSKSSDEKNAYESLAKKIKAASKTVASLLLVASMAMSINQPEPKGSV